MDVDGVEHLKRIFFAETCISAFTCIVRSDYNFAMGLLSYYMIKNAGTKVAPTAKIVSAESFFLPQSFSV